jgi:hypothetical protein
MGIRVRPVKHMRQIGFPAMLMNSLATRVQIGTQ